MIGTPTIAKKIEGWPGGGFWKESLKNNYYTMIFHQRKFYVISIQLLLPGKLFDLVESFLERFERKYKTVYFPCDIP